MKATTLYISFFVFFVCTFVSNVKSLEFISTDGKYEQRHLEVGTWNFELFKGAWFRSLQIEESKPNLSGDYLLGSIYVVTAYYPSFWLGYYTADNNKNINQPITNNTDLSSYNVSTSSSFIVSSFLLLEEKTPDGTTRVRLTLDLLKWTYSPQRSDLLSNPSLGIQAFVVQGTNPYVNVSIEIQFIATQQGGLLNTSGDVLVIPKAIKSIINIEWASYENPNNSLVLTTAVGTSNTTWNNVNSMQAGSGSGQVFFYLDPKAFCDGEFQKINLTRVDNPQGKEVFVNPAIPEQLTARYGKDVGVELIQVKFPPNTSQIVYDPMMGAGGSPYDPQPPTPGNDIDNIAVIVGATVGTFVGVIILVGIFCVYRRKRDGYATVDMPR